MSWIFDALGSAFFARALVGGALVAVICGIVGSWVVIRGMAFLGEAIGHGMLPGVALATIVGAPPVVGGAISAAAMSTLIALLQRRGRLSYDTSIGLLFVAMLAAGVIIVSHSGSFATDVTAVLFGDILAISAADIALLAAVSVGVVAIAAARHRAFVAVAFDRRIAQALGYRPALTQGMLVGLVTLAVVASAQAVGTLLVIALLLGPAVAAQPWSRRIPGRMALATGFGIAAVAVGLAVSWAAGSAAGSTIAVSAVAAAGASHTAHAAAASLRRRNSHPSTLESHA
ncbi:zinc/manganese transport system permease protein/manganese/iron transport system permease protein [Leucobacter komagatae]|uniref:Zinc/manganese transport system permease protein/manganese/iron transport system permease protein n=1 Tax=Leucobacter komagatae TaxID=55969 RepID=A0A542Y4N3_9MICO|nr:zinc ABC transporter permease AztB [Leucobacter komagatae]TQL43036.1 zinc/manganese transport system permease protein/manganese/iron transport system permease protein [Leucobacter komagatae]